MRLQRHYASSRYVQRSALVGLVLGSGVYAFLPDEALVVVAAILRNGWLVLGVIGALSVQIALRLMSLGEDRQLTAAEQSRLDEIVDERLRYLFDLSFLAVVGIAFGIAAGAVASDSDHLRILVTGASTLTVWAGLLAMRLYFLMKEIKSFLWRVAQERGQSEKRAAMLKSLAEDSQGHIPEIPEPLRRNGV